MDDSSLRALLDQLASCRTSVETAYGALSALPFADLGFARVDHHRPLRQGFPEAVYAPGKTMEQCRAIVAELLAEPGAGPILLTRVSPEVAAAVLEGVPGGRYLAEARLGVWAPRPARRLGAVAVVCAGTSDLPVADEAAAVLSALGWPPTRCNDVGVAGLHRLLAEEKKLRAVDVVIVVAGMEGALASAVGGLVAAPVVAVPTSTGYGVSFAGLTALLAMLASCAPGVTAVGIDNGYGAACAAARLLGTIDRRQPEGSVETTP